jgi:DNA-binding LacI/PurR family transcriptional regulator
VVLDFDRTGVAASPTRSFSNCWPAWPRRWPSGSSISAFPPAAQDERAYQDQVNARVVDGFIFLGQGERDPMLRDLAKLGVPFVVWGAVDPSEPYCAVGSDNRLGGRLAGEYFLRSGRKDWLFIGDTNHAEIAMRHDGLERGGARQIRLHPGAAHGRHVIHLDAQRHRRLPRRESRARCRLRLSDTAAMAVIAAFKERDCARPMISRWSATTTFRRRQPSPRRSPRWSRKPTSPVRSWVEN